MRAKKLCVFGDSIGKGVVFDSSKGRYVTAEHPFIKLLGERTGAVIDSYCRFGCTLDKGAEIIEKKLDRLGDYDYVVLQYGGNDSDFDWAAVADSPEAFHDCKTPVARFREIYENLLEKITSVGARPIMMNLAPVDSEKYYRWISRENDGGAIMRFLGEARRIEHWNEMFNNAVWSTAALMGVPVLDIRSPLLFERDFTSFICEDGIHPNEAGHELIADRILSVGGALLC